MVNSDNIIRSFEHLSEPVLITKQKWPEGTLPLVHTRTMSYNHEDFIKECLDGILMQKTTFPVQVLIHDDASTDSTSKIIQDYVLKYPKLIKYYRQKENSYSQPDKHERRREFMSWRLGEYEAVCEGDDYWIDSLKLQKQVDFLESNHDYGLVVTDFSIFHQKNKSLEESLFRNQPENFPIYDNLEDFLLNTGYMAPCTWLCRKEFLPKHNKNYVDGTFAWLLDIYAESKVGFIKDTTTVYRVLEESASHSKSRLKLYKRELGIKQIQFDYIEKYKLSESLKNQVLIKYYNRILPALIILKNKGEIEIARKVLSDTISIKTKLLFLLNRTSFGAAFLKIIFKFKS